MCQNLKMKIRVLVHPFTSIVFIFCLGVTLELGGVRSALAANAYAAILEDQTSVPNGNGVSSPSFWGGLSGENPAGLAYNTTFKAQGTGASFNSSLSPVYGSGGILLGNGVIGMGAEYARYDSGGNTAYGGLADWGIAGRFVPIHTTIGFSGEYTVPGSVGTYNVGALIDLSRSIRFGAMLVNVSNGLHSSMAAGLNVNILRSWDLVVDTGYRIENMTYVIKPGLNFHHHWFLLSGAYGFKMVGDGAVFVTPQITGAIGVRLASFMLLEYEYQQEALHRVGLTLRWN